MCLISVFTRIVPRHSNRVPFPRSHGSHLPHGPVFGLSQTAETAESSSCCARAGVVEVTDLATLVKNVAPSGLPLCCDRFDNGTVDLKVGFIKTTRNRRVAVTSRSRLSCAAWPGKLCTPVVDVLFPFSRHVKYRVWTFENAGHGRERA